MNENLTLDELIAFYRLECEAQKLLDDFGSDDEDEKFTKVEKYQRLDNDDNR